MQAKSKPTEIGRIPKIGSQKVFWHYFWRVSRLPRTNNSLMVVRYLKRRAMMRNPLKCCRNIRKVVWTS